MRSSTRQFGISRYC